MAGMGEGKGGGDLGGFYDDSFDFLGFKIHFSKG
jgi:hypothetical protein